MSTEINIPVESKRERKNRIQREHVSRKRLDPIWMKKQCENSKKYYAKKRLDPEWMENRRKNTRESVTRSRDNRSPELKKKDNTRDLIYYKTHPTMRDKRKALILGRKQYILNILGGKCVICGYNNYIGAIEFHETEKIFHPIPSRCLQTKAGYQLMLDNIDKIIPMCSNCHKEYHARLIELPVKPSTNNQK